MTALPSLENATQCIFLSPTIHGAYRTVLEFETWALRNPQSKQVIYARVLGYLLLKGPSDTARANVATEVTSCTQDPEPENKLAELGEWYVNYFIRPFKRIKGHTPIPSNHASRPSFDIKKDMILDMLKEAPQDYRTAKKHALVRDGFRCVLSGNYDHTSVRRNKELLAEVKLKCMKAVPTNCAHIFDESMNAHISAEKTRHYADSVWDVMDRLGFLQIRPDLNGNGVHRLENVLTLELAAHTLFNELLIWFEATREAHAYTIRSPDSVFTQGYPTTITFTTSNEGIPPPSPTYLAIHAACAEIAHLSGAGEAIDQILRDIEDITVLDEHGGSMDALQFCLLPLTRQNH